MEFYLLEFNGQVVKIIDFGTQIAVRFRGG